MTSAELVTRIQQDFVAQANDLVDPTDYDNAVASAGRDIGIALPVTTDFLIKAYIERSTRHLFFILMIASARKFRAEAFHLDQRYEHYKELVKMLDEKWEIDQAENVYELAGASKEDMFGTQIPSGFSTNSLGEDTTYMGINIIKSSMDE